MRFTCLVWLWLVIGVAAHAQQYNFRTWSVADGLPQSEVSDIIQDHRMQIWVATRGGISRFNGSIFHTYNKQQGLASNNTSVLFQDSRKLIWVGSSDNGLTRFDGVDFKRYSTAQGLPAGGIYSITEDKTGKLWVATDSGIYTLQQDRFLVEKQFPKQVYTSVHVDLKGIVWAGSLDQGLYKLQQNELSQFNSGNTALPSNRITVLYSYDRAQTLWVGTSQGPAYISDDSLHTVSLPATVAYPEVSDFTPDAYGNMLVGLRLHGLLTIQQDSVIHLTKANGLRSDHVTALLTDKESNVWLGTDGFGLQQSRAQWFLHYFDFGTLKEPTITALAKDTKGRVWFGTDNGEAGYMQQGKLTTLSGNIWPAGTVLYSMWVKSEEDVWVSTSRGIWNLTPDKATQYTIEQGLPSDIVYFVAPGPEDKVWAATTRGVAYSDNKQFIPVKTSSGEATGRTYHLFRDKENNLWAGTDNGIFILKNNLLHPVNLLRNTPFGEVTAITQDKNGWLYFAGYNFGLLAYHPKQKKTKLFTAGKGLPNEGLKTLYIDNDQQLWVGTNSNILKIDLPYFHQTQKLKFRTYNSNSGFRGIEVAHNGITQTPDGKIWFGTARGLTQYIPQLDRINKAEPELYLTDIKLFMRPTNWQEHGIKTNKEGLPVNLRLPYNKNHITFDFQGICMTSPAEVKYKYMLTNHDQQWSETTEQSFVSYANLDPGVYTFKVKAQNNDGYWTAEPLTYTFNVIPPLWRREWFVGVLLLLISGTVLTIIRVRERSLLKMNALLDMRVKHRTRMLERKHREKELLLQEVHHRVKNNLQIVISLLNLQARHVQDPSALEVMKAIRSRVRSMALLHERLYRHNNLEHIDLEDYFREICESLYAAYGISEDKVKLQLAIPPVKIDIDAAITLGLIVNELVSNTLKYAFPGVKTGSLLIELQPLKDDRYKLTVADNGIGCTEKQDAQQSFGLQLVNSLSKKLDGELSSEIFNGTKTILYFVLPS